MISMYDLSFYDFLLLCMHVLSFVIYTKLGLVIAAHKKYLKWNSHIYPRMMIASFGIALVFGSELVARQNYNVFFHLFMWLFAYNQYSEIYRLAEKYNKIEELQNRIAMKNLTLLLLITSLFLVSCGSRKVELEKLKKERTENAQKHTEEVERLQTAIKEKEQRETDIKKEIEQKKSQIEKLQSENKKLVEKLNEQKKDDISITNANGMVTVTDSNGNTYQIPSTQGTTINRKSESTLSKELSETTETLRREQETNQYLNAVISERDKTISENQTEIDAYKALTEKQQSEIREKEQEKKKNSDRKAYPVVMWIGLGIVITVLAQLLWKVYKPKKLI